MTKARLGDRPALIAICAVGTALRVAWLFQPIRYDEAFTFNAFVRAGFRSVVTDYGVPNNHVFHTLLVWLCAFLSTDVWAIRLPAFLAGIAVPPAAYCVGRRLHGREAALLGAALVACSVHLIEYSTNARGYSIVTLFALIQVWLAEQIVRAARHRDLALFAFVTALGFYTVPTMLYPTAATLAWATAIALTGARSTPWRALAWRTPTYAALGATLTVALYLPILLQPHGWENLTSNRFVAPLGSIDAWRRAMADLGVRLVEDWSLGLARGGLVAVTVLAVVGSIVAAVKRRDARPTWLLVAPVVVSALLFVQRVVPFARVFCFALPMLLLAGAAGLAELLRVCRATRAVPMSSVALCVGLSAYVAIARLPDRAGEADKFPDAAAVVAFLSPKVAAGDAVIYGVVPAAPIQYVLFRQGRPPFGYRAGAARMWIVTRADGAASEAIQSRTNRLRPDDFEEPRLAFERGVARVYEAVPRDGGTPERARRHRVESQPTNSER